MRHSPSLSTRLFRIASPGVACLFLVCSAALAAGERPIASLQVEDAHGKTVPLPLQHTEVRGEVSGFVARVEVTQTYGNPFDEPIEATYVFPLPERAAVDDFLMEIGPRRVRGEVHRREEARRIYEEARSSGYTASLLEQERPNIFTQSVANILPGDAIRIHIRYVDVLPYEDGAFRFLFPMVVGPRYFPGGAERSVTGRGARSSGPDPAEPPADAGAEGIYQPPDPPTDVVEDARRISPRVLRRGFRSGRDISLTLDVRTAVPLVELVSDSHEIVVYSRDARRARVTLADNDRIPNKDFMLRVHVAQDLPEAGLIAHRAGEDGFFALRLQPKAAIDAAEAAPKEILFVLDQSGSMSGLPIEMSKRFMRRALETLGPDDRFNIIRFSSDARSLAPSPLPADRAFVEIGLQTIREMSAGGGTEMLRGLEEALAQPADPERFRILFFLSDGYIGNEQQIFDAIRNQARDARVFTLGIGSSVNHYLLREMAALGDGAYEYIRPDGNESEAVERFHRWVTLPYLTDLEVDWGGLAVEDLQPSRLPDLFSGQTLTLVGRYLWGGDETVIVRGRLAGRRWEKQVPVHLPEREESNAALASVWARHRIRDLLLEGPTTPEVEFQVTSLALAFRLMSPFTSFVAVDESEVANPGGDPLPVQQALPMPEFVTFEGCFGPDGPDAIRPEEPQPAETPGDEAGAVRVEIHDALGPARGARAVLFNDTRNEGSERLTGEDGVARFDAVLPGPGYTLAVLYHGSVFESNRFDVPPGVKVIVPISTVAPERPVPEPDPGAGETRPEATSAPGGTPPTGAAGTAEPIAARPAAGSGALIGQVVDRSGHLMPGVTITARSPSASMAPVGTVTDAGGRYRLPALPAASDWVVLAELPGFAKVEVSPIHLEAGKTTTQNFSLVSSSETTTFVRVVGKGDIVDVASAKTATVFHSEFIEGLPIMGRSYRDILTLAPGVVDVGGARSSTFRGERQVDGANGSGPVPATYGQNLDLEAVAELEIVTTGGSAEFSAAQGGFASIVTGKTVRAAGAARRGAPTALTETLSEAVLSMSAEARVVEPALRVLADLADDRRLSRAEGLPALAGLLGAQDRSGRLGGSLREHALATWALAEARRSYPDLPWLAQAAEAAVAFLGAAAYGDARWPAIQGGKVDLLATSLAQVALSAAGVELDGPPPVEPVEVPPVLSGLAGEAGARLAGRVHEGLRAGRLGPSPARR